jgi:hypothetical protein
VIDTKSPTLLSFFVDTFVVILGTSLWDVIRLLRDQAALIPVVELKYSDEVNKNIDTAAL